MTSRAESFSLLRRKEREVIFVKHDPDMDYCIQEFPRVENFSQVFVNH